MKELIQDAVCKNLIAVVIADEIAYYRCNVSGGKPNCHLKAFEKGFVDSQECKYNKNNKGAI